MTRAAGSLGSPRGAPGRCGGAGLHARSVACRTAPQVDAAEPANELDEGVVVRAEWHLAEGLEANFVHWADHRVGVWW